MKKRMKKAGIAFLAAMVLFTFLSRAAASMTTAVVGTTKAVSGRITHTVSALGKVEAGVKYAVLVPENRYVEEVYGKEGDTVEEGEPLLRVSENTALRRAEEDLFVWEKEGMRELQEAEEVYLAAYEAWQAYLEKTASWYWKADDDLEEDRLELAMREKEYEYFGEYQEYLEMYLEMWESGERSGQEALQEASGTGQSEGEQSGQKASGTGQSEGEASGQETGGEGQSGQENGQAAQNELQEALREVWNGLQSAQEAYWEYQRSRERTYQFSRPDAETSCQEALEEAIPAYQSALQEFEEAMLKYTRAVEDATDSSTDNEGNVLAPVSGTIESIDVKIGEKTSAAEAAVIAAVSDEKQLTAELSSEYETELVIGASVSLKKYGSTEELAEGVIKKIAWVGTDTSVLQVTIVTEEASLELGDLVTADFSRQTESYSMVLPTGALRSENGETFVLAVSEKEGILGTILEAEKIRVTVLDKNSDYAAVSGDGISDREIILETDREIQAGSRIRKEVS
ncbi:MAG: hypothetical protein Q4F41_05055 [Eubacteriales bacterium]|nr:hypothetical protein [Eubacteriales bacterium]